MIKKSSVVLPLIALTGLLAGQSIQAEDRREQTILQTTEPQSGNLPERQVAINGVIDDRDFIDNDSRKGPVNLDETYTSIVDNGRVAKNPFEKGIPKRYLQRASYTPRLTEPDWYSKAYQALWDRYFWSNGNCTTYAAGRFYEINQDTGFTDWVIAHAPNANGMAYNWYPYAKSRDNGKWVGSQPKLGAVATWDGSYNGGAGHVAIVEKIEGDMVTISESNYGGPRFRVRTLSKHDMGRGFQGYIYQVQHYGNDWQKDGSFIKRPNGQVYRIAGGSPLEINDLSPFGNPTIYQVSEADYATLKAYPNDNTYLFAKPSNRLYRVVNGHPYRVSSWSQVGGEKANIAVNDSTIDARRHLKSGHFGTVDKVVGLSGAYELSGWAVDGDAPARRSQLEVYTDGHDQEKQIISTGIKRLDVASSFPGLGDNTGFKSQLKTKYRGRQKVIVYVKNTAGQGGYERIDGDKQTVVITEPKPAKAITNLPEGLYKIKGVKSNKYVSVYGAETNHANGINIHLWEGADVYNQVFKLERQADGSYKIRGLNSWKVMEVTGSISENGRNVQQWDNNQSWWLVETGQNQVKLINRDTGLALDVTGASSANGANIQGYQDNGSQAQRFALEPYKKRLDIKEGVYGIQGEGSKRYLDVAGASAADGANIQIYDGNNSKAQQFKFKRQADGSYQITSLNAGKQLDVAGALRKDGTNVQQWASKQTWWLLDEGKGKVALMNRETGKVLDVAGVGKTNGSNVQIYTHNHSGAQQFKLIYRTT